MENITIIKNVGHGKKTEANWSYSVHIIIDQKGARYYRSTFAGEEITIKKLKEEGFTVNVLHAGGIKEPVKIGVRTIKAMQDIENYQGDNYPEK